MKHIVHQPLITEKTLLLARGGWYTFRVDFSASKGVIAQEIEKLYDVSVRNVRTIILHGKMRKAGKRMQKKQLPSWKKSLVQLKKGQTLPMFEISPEEGK